MTNKTDDTDEVFGWCKQCRDYHMHCFNPSLKKDGVCKRCKKNALTQPVPPPPPMPW